MPEPTPSDPKKVDRKEYRWCEPCGAYVYRKHLRVERPDTFFEDDARERTLCPAGHELPAEGSAA